MIGGNVGPVACCESSLILAESRVCRSSHHLRDHQTGFDGRGHRHQGCAGEEAATSQER